MSPFNYLPHFAATAPSTDEAEARRRADILAREVTPPPKDGQTSQHYCVVEDCKHTSAGPSRLCPVHAPNPPKLIGDYMPLETA